MRNLVFTSAGNESKHLRFWLNDRHRKNFDLVVAYYGNETGRYVGTADLVFERKGSKWQNLVFALERYPHVLNMYDAYFLLDDDIELSTSDINGMFDMRAKHGLDLCQPAYTPDSHTYWDILKLNNSCVLRYTNFVECGVPLFSRAGFQKCQHTFAAGISGNGMDHAWPQLVGIGSRNVAVVDAITCKHPLRISEIDQIISREEQCYEGKAVMQDLGLCFLSPTVKEAVPRFSALSPIPSWAQLPLVVGI